jgi:hypothetical protein
MSGCHGEFRVHAVSNFNTGDAVGGLRPESAAPPLTGARRKLLGPDGFLTLLVEAGFDLRLDLGATSARAFEWLVVIGVSVGSLALWLLAMRSADLGQLTDLGVVSVLPLWSYLAFVPIVVAFVIVLCGPRPSTWLLAAVVVLLILMLYGAVPFVEGEPRFSPSWRHIGIIDFVTRHGGVDPTIDAYHNWPGMFILASAMAGAVGLTDFTPLALWAPVWFNLLYLPPLFVLLSALTDDRRAVWLAIWLFYLMDWIGQDYFSPQAFGLFFFLTAMAVIVRWFAAPDAVSRGEAPVVDVPLIGRLPRPIRSVVVRLLEREPMPADRLSPASRAGLMALFLVMLGFTITGHQLTPFFLVSAVGALVLVARVRWPSLPILMGVMIAAWVAFVAVAFLIGHFQNVAGYVGTLSDSLAANLIGRLQGSSGHRFVVYVRLVFAAGVWVLAGLGILRRMRAGRWDVTSVALAVAPFPLFAVQAYGGEMLLRIYLFSLPFMALLIAFAFLPRRRLEPPAWLAVIVVVASLALVGPFMVARYGNERIESFTPGEVAAVDQLYQMAPKGSMFVGVVGDVPWKNIRYEEYRYRPGGDDTYYHDLDSMFTAMSTHNGPVFLILTRTQAAYTEMILGASPEDWTAFEQELFATGWFDVISRTPDATIARFVPPRRAS